MDRHSVNQYEQPLRSILKPRSNKIRTIKNKVNTITKSVLDYFRPFIKFTKNNNDNNSSLTEDDQQFDFNNKDLALKDKADLKRIKAFQKKSSNKPIVRFDEISSQQQDEQAFQPNQSLKVVQDRLITEKQQIIIPMKPIIPYYQIRLQSLFQPNNNNKVDINLDKQINQDNRKKLSQNQDRLEFHRTSLKYSQKSQSQSLKLELQHERSAEHDSQLSLKEQTIRNKYKTKFQIQKFLADQVQMMQEGVYSQPRKRVKLSETLKQMKQLNMKKQNTYEQIHNLIPIILKDYKAYYDKSRTIKQKYETQDRHTVQMGNTLMKLQRKRLQLKSAMDSDSRKQKLNPNYQPVKVIVKPKKTNLNLQSILKVVKECNVKQPQIQDLNPPSAPIEIQAPVISQSRTKQIIPTGPLVDRAPSASNKNSQDSSNKKSLFTLSSVSIFGLNKQENKQKPSQVSSLSSNSLFGKSFSLFNNLNQQKDKGSQSGKVDSLVSLPSKLPQFSLFKNLNAKVQPPKQQPKQKPIQQPKQPSKQFKITPIQVQQIKKEVENKIFKNSQEDAKKVSPVVAQKKQCDQKQAVLVSKSVQQPKADPQKSKTQIKPPQQNPFIKKPSIKKDYLNEVINNFSSNSNLIFGGKAITDTVFNFKPAQLGSKASQKQEDGKDHFSTPTKNILQGLIQQPQVSQVPQAQQPQQDQSSMFDQSQQSASRLAQEGSSSYQHQHTSVNRLASQNTLPINTIPGNLNLFGPSSLNPPNIFVTNQQNPFLNNVASADVKKSLQMFSRVGSDSGSLWGNQDDNRKKSQTNSQTGRRKSKEQRVYM